MKRNPFALRIAGLLAACPLPVLRNDLSAEAQALLAAVNKSTDEVKNLALDAQKQAKTNSELSASLREAVDKALTGQAETTRQLVDLQQEIAAKLAAGAGTPAPLTLGAAFTADERVAKFLQSVEAGSQDAKIRATFKTSGLRNDVSSAAASGGALVVAQNVPGVIGLPRMRLTVRDLLNWGRTTQNSIQYFKELAFTNNAAPVSELTTKPKSEITYEADSAEVVTIAHHIRASKQILADVPQLQGNIDGRLRYGLKLKEEGQLLKGTGVGLNLEGLMTASDDYAAPSGAAVTSENRIDRLRLAILQVELSGYYADGIVLSPTDWTNIELLKDGNDRYLVGNPFGQIAPTLWGRPVVASQSQDVGDYLVGAFAMAAQGWDREEISVQIGYNGDDFTQNALTLLCEERLALTIYRGDALVNGSFGSL